MVRHSGTADGGEEIGDERREGGRNHVRFGAQARRTSRHSDARGLRVTEQRCELRDRFGGNRRAQIVVRKSGQTGRERGGLRDLQQTQDIQRVLVADSARPVWR